MNNEKILNIMENLSKAVYDIAATTKHIYKDEHPTGPTMPMPTMPGQPKLPPPALWSNQPNQFPPVPPQWPPAPGPHSMVKPQDMQYSNSIFQQVFHPNDNSSLKSKQVPHPTKPNEFCNMQDYTFQKLQRPVPAQSTILSDPFMPSNQKVTTDPDRYFSNIDLAGGNPEDIRELAKKNPELTKKAAKNVGLMEVFGGDGWNIENNGLDNEIEKLRVGVSADIRNCATAPLTEKLNKLIGLTLARSYMQFGESEQRKELLRNEMKGNEVALQIFNEVIKRDEDQRDKEFKKNLEHYQRSKAIFSSTMGVGESLADSMDNWGKETPTKGPAPVNIPVGSVVPMDLYLRPSDKDIEKNYLSSIDAKETVGKMKDTLPEFSRLLNEPPHLETRFLMRK